jgi:hypothetical protein
VHIVAEAAHSAEQVPAPSHTWMGSQTVPQAPQLFLSVSVLTQTPPHISMPGTFSGQMHSPPSQTDGEAHTLPQPPQFSRSIRGSTHAAPHLISPGWQPELSASSISSGASGASDPSGGVTGPDPNMSQPAKKRRATMTRDAVWEGCLMSAPWMSHPY